MPAACAPVPPASGNLTISTADWIRFRWKYHASLLAIATMVLVTALALEIHSTQRIALPLVGMLPGACLWQQLFEFNCPGCGLTRCFVSLAHGNILAAWEYNPAGLLMFALLIYQIPFRIVQLVRLRQGLIDYRHGPWAVQIIVWGVVSALLGQWIWRNFISA